MRTKEAIKVMGGIRKLAAGLDIWPHAIYRWGEYPPRLRQFEIELLTNGVLKVEPS